MSDHSYTEVTSRSWFRRIGDAIKGLVFGLLLFVVSFPLLFWNEGRAVDRSNALDESAGAVISVSSELIESSNEAKLVHLSAFADTKETLSDASFGVEENALKLRREVEVYQWIEEESSKTKKKLGGGEETVTTYTYTKGWSEDLIDSEHFTKPGYDNPINVPFDSTEYDANDVNFGAFELSRNLLAKINRFEPIAISPSAVLPESSKAKVYGEGFYVGDNPSSPAVGDLRVKFSKVSPQTVSVIAQQSGHTFQTYTTSNGGSISLLELGEVSTEVMFQTAHDDNATITWILRGAGLFCMFLGLSLLLKPISVFADVVPFIGTVAEAGISIVSLLVSIVLSFVTIAIAWIFYRPIVGIALLVAAVGVLWLLRNKFKAAKLVKLAKLNETEEAVLQTA